MLALRQANIIIQSALAKAREMSLRPLVVVVVDHAGNIVAAQREDGATMFQFDVALGKAWGSVAMRSSSRALANRAKTNPNFFLTLASTSKGKLVPQTGAVLIRDAAGAILGAAGASGGGHSGEEDEICCVYGIEQAGLQPDASE
jgi:uncharacterized protein GlcG (DUF336 family)